MSDRFVGQADRTLAQWYDGAELVMTGDAFAQYLRVHGGVLEYLQDDGSFDEAFHEFELEIASDGFERFFTWPASAKGYLVTERARHSVYGLSGSAEHYVTENDLDDAAARGGGLGGGVVTVSTAMSPQERELIAAAASEAVWSSKKRGLTEPVEIAGTRKRLDQLNDVSAEQVRQEVDQSNAAQTEVLSRKIEKAETRESAAERIGKMGAAILAQIRELEGVVGEIRPTVDSLHGVGESAREEIDAVGAAVLVCRDLLRAVKRSLEVLETVSPEQARDLIEASAQNIIDESQQRTTAALEAIAEKSAQAHRSSENSAALARLDKRTKDIALAVAHLVIGEDDDGGGDEAA